MTIEDFKKLKVGDRIKITSSKLDAPKDLCDYTDNRWNQDGLMDKYLGATLTITEIPDSYFPRVKARLANEDWNRWNWYPEMIDYKICGDLEII